MNYAGIPDRYAQRDTAKILLRSIPYDGTSTWGKGADKGFEAFMEASENMELYDIETDSEVYHQGVFITPELDGFQSPEQMFQATYEDTKKYLPSGQFLTTIGGEHSISIGIIKAFYEQFDDLSVLQIDAHADLRPEYGGTPYNHACAMYDASQHCNLVQVGIRSMDIGEKPYIQKGNCFFMHQIQHESQWMQAAVNRLSNNVYISFDLDAFDPSICPGTGTPEPGGFFWYQALEFLRLVFEQKNVVGLDIVELAPLRENRVSEFLAAKLYYKLLSYKFALGKE